MKIDKVILLIGLALIIIGADQDSIEYIVTGFITTSLAIKLISSKNKGNKRIEKFKKYGSETRGTIAHITIKNNKSVIFYDYKDSNGNLHRGSHLGNAINNDKLPYKVGDSIDIVYMTDKTNKSCLKEDLKTI